MFLLALEVICCYWHYYHDATHHSSFGVISKKGLRINWHFLGLKIWPLGPIYLYRVTETFYINMATKLTMWMLHFITGLQVLQGFPHKEDRRNSAISLQRFKWPRLDSSKCFSSYKILPDAVLQTALQRVLSCKAKCDCGPSHIEKAPGCWRACQ